MSSFALDLFSAAVLRDPYPHYHRLRESFPVLHDAQRKLWIVGRWSNVIDVLQRPDVYSSAGSFDPTLVGADGEAHTRVRRIVSRAFSAKTLAALEATIHETASQLVDQIASNGYCDLVADFAVPLPLLVTMNLLGLAPGHLREFKTWARETVRGDVELPSRGERRQFEKRRAAFQSFFEDHVGRCGRSDTPSLLGGFLHAEGDDDRLTLAETVGVAKLLLVAGSETVSNLIGNAALALLRNPEQTLILRDDPAKIPGMIEEVLRYDAPVQRLQRKAVRDDDIAGVHLPAGTDVIVLVGSANRDPERFAEPDRFWIGRDVPEHVAFGAGPHRCLGARLARQEARIAFEVLFARLAGWRAAGPLDAVEYDSLWVRGPRSLPLEIQRG